MNYPTEDQIVLLAGTHVLKYVNAYDRIIETINLIKQLNPEPELVWPKGANYVVLDEYGLWWYENKPYFIESWEQTGLNDELNYVLYPALCAYAMSQFMNKLASDCLIERVR